MGFREGEKDGDRLWIAIICEMPPHCSRAAPSLHHLPTSFISSARHWEHSTTHLPPVNIAWRLNYTHTHSQTQAQSQWNSLQWWSRESASNLWGIHSSEWVCVFVVLCLLVCFCDLSIHYYMVTFVAQRVCALICEHSELISSQSQPTASRSILSFYALINRLLKNCHGLTTGMPCFCPLFFLADDEWQWWNLTWQLHQKGRPAVFPLYYYMNSCSISS